jgi:hypothetical protein
MNNKLSIFHFLRKFNNNSALLLLILLLCADFVFILIHSIIDLSPVLRRGDFKLFSISEDRSYPELFQYLKWFWMTIMLIIISRSKRSLGYLSWALLTTYFLLDDSIGIHELIGTKIAAGLNFTAPFSLRKQDIGELIVSGVFAIILVAPIVISYLRGDSEFKRFSLDMLLLMALLFFFGVFVDVFAYVFPISERMNIIIGFIEDGGEMIVASLLLWYVFQLSDQVKGNSLYLFDYFRVKE